MTRSERRQLSLFDRGKVMLKIKAGSLADLVRMAARLGLSDDF